MIKYFGLLIFRETKKLTKTYLIWSAFYVLFSVSPILVSAQEISDSVHYNPSFLELKTQIDSIISHAIKNEAFPGCVVYAGRQDSVIFYKSYGYHTYDSLILTQKDDIYDLASVTKVVGATLAMMKLYDDGLVDLDAPINHYVEKLNGKMGKVTLREALAHQGGLYPWIPYHQVIRKKNGGFKKRDIVTVADEKHPFGITDSLYLSNDFYAKRIKRLIKNSKVAKQPTYTYSGLLFYLIPEMVMSLTGVEFNEYLQTNFYRPLQLKTLGFNPLNRFSLDQIPPTEVDTFFRMQPIHGTVHDEGAIMMKGISGNAGLFGNTEDLRKVMNLLINEGQLDTLRLLAPQTVQLFTTSQYPNLENRRGLGFDKPLLQYDSLRSSVAEEASYKSFGHTGYTGTLVWADPTNDLVFIFLSNRVYPSRKNTAIYRLNVRPTIHQLFYNYLDVSSQK